MTPDATRTADARVDGGELARFAVGVVASALLVALTTTALLAVLPSLLPGWRTTAVSSGSMVPAFDVGDAVVVKEPDPADGLLGPPTVVLVEREGLEPLLHRVLDTDGRTYRTQGDANPQPDTDRVDPAHVLGVGRLVVPYGGWVSLWWGRGEYVALALLVAALALLARLARYGWLDAHDPWKLAARRAVDDEDDEPSWPGADASARPSRDDVPPARAEGGVLAWRDLSVRAIQPRLRGIAWVVSVALLVGAGTATATASAFSGVATLPSTMAAGTLAPPTSLTASCASSPSVVATVVAGPGEPAPSYPSAARSGDTLLLSRAGQMASDGAGGYITPPAPSGWAVLSSQTGQAGAFHALYKKGADDTPIPVPHSSGDADMLVVVRSAVSLGAASGGGLRPANSSAQAPSLAGTAGGLLLTFWAAARGDVAFSAPPSMSPLATRATPTISLGAHSKAITVTGGTGTSTTNLTDAGSGGAVSAINSGISVFYYGSSKSQVSWTASASSNVTGYTVQRDGQDVATLTGRTTTSWTDPNPATASTTYTVITRFNNWKSLPVSATPPSGGC